MFHAARLAALFVLASLAACSSADTPVATPKPPAPEAPTVPGHSIDRTAMDTSVKPGDDFYLFANGSWLKTAQIPPDRVTTGVWLRVQNEIDAHVRELVEAAAKAPADATAKKIGDYYATYLDEAAIEKLGKAPLAPALDRIAKIADKTQLATAIGLELRADVDPLNNTSMHTPHVFGLWIDQDLNAPDKNAAFLLQGGLGMPDKSFYTDSAKDKVELRDKYVKHLAAMLKLAGVADADAKAQKVMALEAKIAAAHASRTDSENVSKSNNPWPRAEFAARAPGMAWDAFFAAARLDKEPTITVWQPSAIVGVARLVASEPLDDWKALLTAHAIDEAAPFLSKAFVDESFAFYGKALSGTEAQPPRWRAALDMTNAALGEDVGKLYVAKYFPPSSKAAIEQMVKNLLAAFDRRIDGLAWMAPETKAKAKEKLKTLRVGVGYPDVWRNDSMLNVVRGDALGNYERAALWNLEDNLAKLGGPVRRGSWVMTPQEVNAVNLPVRNEIQFPAAILVPPFFDPKSTDAANYGSTGATIGHEISHSFDDEGSKFDAHGQLKNWWTKDDLAHFEASGAALAAQFDTYKPFPDLHVDGKLTLSENIADLAGLAVAYDAWKASLKGAPAPTQDGFTGDQQFFLAFEQSWQEKIRDEALRSMLTTNGHAPPHYRGLTVRNLDPWYAAFDVQPGAALFLAPNTRVRVW